MNEQTFEQNCHFIRDIVIKRYISSPYVILFPFNYIEMYNIYNLHIPDPTFDEANSRSDRQQQAMHLQQVIQKCFPLLSIPGQEIATWLSILIKFYKQN